MVAEAKEAAKEVGAMVVEKARKMMLLRSAASSFANRALRKGMNGWVAMRNERLKALARMEHAALGITRPVHALELFALWAQSALDAPAPDAGEDEA